MTAEYEPCGTCSVCTGQARAHGGEPGNSGPGWIPALPGDSCRARWAHDRARAIFAAAGFSRPA
jgi:hypothetical protein